MAAKYCFFRTPEGKPHRGNDGKYAPAGLLAALGRAASGGLDSNGNLMVPNLAFLEWKLALNNLVIIIGPDDGELNEVDSSAIVAHATVETMKHARGKPISPEQFLQEANTLSSAYFRQSKANYVLISSLATSTFPCRRIQVGDCVIIPLVKRPTQFRLPEAYLAMQGSDLDTDFKKCDKYQHVKIETSGRSVHEAATAAFNALDLVRAYWSLAATMGSWKLMSPPRNPMGAIHTGPVQTLHHPDGMPVNLYWYEPDFYQPMVPYSSDKWPLIEKWRRKAMRRVSTSKFAVELNSILVRYARTLDERNLDFAFLQMWSILERITNTVGAQYDETIRRAAWIYDSSEDRLLCADLLAAIRCRRNGYVHAGRTSGEDGYKHAYLVKSFVDPHLKNLINNPFQIQSLKDYSEFLCLPSDETALKLKKDRMSLALRLRSKGRKRVETN